MIDGYQGGDKNALPRCLVLNYLIVADVLHVLGSYTQQGRADNPSFDKDLELSLGLYMSSFAVSKHCADLVKWLA